MKRKRGVVVGVLGGIASGKSTVARMFARHGAAVLDADAICSELHGIESVRRAIRRRWGRAVFGPTGALDRAALAYAVFERPREVAALNRILHPRVIRRVRQEVARCRKAGRVCVIDAPLLMESGLDRLCDVLVFVDTDAASRTRRMATARGWSRLELRRRETHQIPVAVKRKAADFVVTNRGSVAATRRQIDRITLHLRGEER